MTLCNPRTRTRTGSTKHVLCIRVRTFWSACTSYVQQVRGHAAKYFRPDWQRNRLARLARGCCFRRVIRSCVWGWLLLVLIVSTTSSYSSLRKPRPVRRKRRSFPSGSLDLVSIFPLFLIFSWGRPSVPSSPSCNLPPGLLVFSFGLDRLSSRIRLVHSAVECESTGEAQCYTRRAHKSKAQSQTQRKIYTFEVPGAAPTCCKGVS